MTNINPEDVIGVAQGLAETDEVTLQVGDGDQSSAAGASQSASTTASTGAEDGDQGGSPDDLEQVDLADVEAALDDEDLTEDEAVALDELRNFLLEEARNEIAGEVVPKLQSTYDRQIANLQRQFQQASASAQAREKELLDAVRDAKLNGLTEAEKAQLKTQWDFEDKMRALDDREQMLTGYHVELLRDAYAQEYAEFGLTAEDLAEFDTPEAMDEFVKEVQLEFYKQLAELRAQGATQVDDEAPQPQPRKPAPKAPAGVSPPSDAGTGGAVPSGKQPITATGAEALRDALRDPDGWENVRVR